MHEFLLIYRTRLRMIGNTIARLGVLQTVSFIFVIVCFFSGSFYVLFRIFSYLAAVEVIGRSLIDRTLEMAFFVFFIMLLFSNIITSFSTFFNNQELESISPNSSKTRFTPHGQPWFSPCPWSARTVSS